MKMSFLMSDFLEFFSGYLYIILAVDTFFWERSVKERIFGRWFYLFFALCGAMEWIEVSLVNNYSIAVFSFTRLFLFSLCALCLFEYLRENFVKSYSFLKAWIYIPIIALLMWATRLGVGDYEVVVSYGIVLAGLFILWILNQRNAPKSLIAAFSLLMVAHFFDVPSSKIFPSTIINAENFQNLCKFPPGYLEQLALLLFILVVYKVLIKKTINHKLSLKINIGFILLTVITLVISFVVLQSREAYYDQKLRGDLLKEAYNISRTIEPNLVKELDFTAKDRDKPAFKLIEEQERLYGQFKGFKSIYSMALKDNMVVFGPESIPENDPVASPPGTPYEKPRKEDLEAFKTLQLYTVGPVTDEYGTFVSAGAPVIDPQTDKLLFILGMDIEVTNWQKTLSLNRLNVFIVSAIFLLLILGGYVFVSLWSREDTSLWLIKPGSIFILIFGLFTSLIFSIVILENNMEYEKTIFDQMALQKLSLIRRSIWQVREYIPELKWFLGKHPNMKREDFREFSKGYLRNYVIASCGFIPRVQDSDRASFEFNLKNEGFEPAIFKKDEKGDHISQERNSEYYPFYIVEPIDEMKSVVGLDTFSTPQRKQAIEEAIVYNQPIVSAPLKRLSTGESALTVYQPIYDQTDSSLRGVGFMTFRPQEFFKLLNRDAKIVGQFNMDLFQLRKDQRPLWVGSSYQEKLSVTQEAENIKLNNDHFVEYYPLMIFGKTYIFRVESTKDLFGIYLKYGLSPLIIFVMLTLMIVYLVENAINYQYRLEGDLKERTKELELNNQALKKANKAALAAADAKSNFLANMSHEIRTPMNAILGFSNLLAKTELNEKQRRYLDLVSTSGQLLLGIINDILDVSKLESGKIQFESIECDVRTTVFDVMKIAVTRMKAKPYDTYVDIKEDVPLFVKTDPLRLKQVLVNLIGNAIKFTTHGEVGIIVEKIHEDNSSLELKFTIRDTGIGISQEQQTKLFQSFSQADDSITRKYGGTGLGLAISKAIVEGLGGSISVESKEGLETKFIFTLKVGKSSQSHVKQDIKISEYFRNKTVFIVEDNKISQKIIKKCCQTLELSVLGICSSPKEAFEKLDQIIKGSGKVPDIILSDIMMEGMTGLEMSKQIKEKEEFKNTLFIAITADLNVESELSSADHIFNAYVTKPISVDILNNALISLVDETRLYQLETTEKSCQGIKVLVAEDVVANQILLEEYFDQLGCTADIVSNGEEAVNKLKAANDYDLCLMDIQMPIMDGISAIKIIRSEISKDFPVIALSAAVLKEEQEIALDAGMTDFMMKPVDFDVLKDKILQYAKPK